MAIQSLFGASVADVQDLLKQRGEKEIAAAGGEFGVFAPLYRAGMRFGMQGAQGINTLLGAQDPLLKKATDIESVLSKYKGQDLTKSTTLNNIAGDLAGLGYSGEALSLAQQAAQTAFKERAEIRAGEELDIKRSEAGLRTDAARRAIAAEERTLLEFFKKNPEQTGPALQQLAVQLEQDPTNAALLDRYTKIANAGSAGSMEDFQKAQKEALTIENIETNIKKNKKELERIGSDFDAGQRWNAEREAALALFRANNLDPTQPLKGAALINTELVNKQSIALREPWTGGTTPRAAPTPAAAPADIKARVERTGQVYDPVKYEYRIGPNGEVQRKEKTPS